MKAISLVLLMLICLTLSACQSISVVSSSPAAIVTSLSTPVVEASAINKPEGIGNLAAQILNAAMKSNYTEIARLMDSVNSTSAINSLFFQVILERIKYEYNDLDVVPVFQMFLDHHLDVNAIEPSDPNDTRTKQTLIMTSACTVGDFVKPLVLAGAEVNPDDANGTPLGCVSSRRNPELVRFLLEHGARLDVRNPLLSAMRPFVHSNFEKENVEIVKMLIEAGSNVNDKDDQGNTPLSTAAMYNQKELVQYLIDHGAQVNAKNKVGRTPLMEAVAAIEGAKSEDAVLEVVKIMLKAGANPNDAPDRDGDTVISLADKYKRPKVAAEIWKYLNAQSNKSDF
ncbi:ankyrin repeat domain-containing protein [Paenibacillus planticolens]|uniref:Ankyrin repeat protein n=1 Tax=Paenibacillus planticolens TaxID=2654976 RepID=A0ABX1ZIJ6_9BACL|nr:ankyrin repeat domain-containing protein [Paenibacillus planticolens]NOU98879.1 hypothetical protein [Paenibacillus planticolens]